jgi:hypothetical protein
MRRRDVTVVERKMKGKESISLSLYDNNLLVVSAPSERWCWYSTAYEKARAQSS